VSGTSLIKRIECFDRHVGSGGRWLNHDVVEKASYALGHGAVENVQTNTAPLGLISLSIFISVALISVFVFHQVFPCCSYTRRKTALDTRSQYFGGLDHYRRFGSLTLEIERLF
jgi:hypothetical protein